MKIKLWSKKLIKGARRAEGANAAMSSKDANAAMHVRPDAPPASLNVKEATRLMRPDAPPASLNAKVAARHSVLENAGRALCAILICVLCTCAMFTFSQGRVVYASTSASDRAGAINKTSVTSSNNESGAAASITVRQELRNWNENLRSGEFTYEIAADGASAPLPEGIYGKTYGFTIRGSKSVTLKIAYDRVGIYKYTIRQTKSDPDEDVRIDEAGYELDVYVLDRGGSLEALPVLINNDGNKPAEAVFDNTYESTGDDGGKAKTGIVNTGDDNRTEIWAGIALIGAVTIIIIIIGRKRRR